MQLEIQYSTLESVSLQKMTASTFKDIQNDTSQDIFTRFETTFHIKVPVSLKNLLIVTGYEDEGSISLIDNNSIHEIEHFAKNVLHNKCGKGRSSEILWTFV